MERICFAERVRICMLPSQMNGDRRILVVRVRAETMNSILQLNRHAVNCISAPTENEQCGQPNIVLAVDHGELDSCSQARSTRPTCCGDLWKPVKYLRPGNRLHTHLILRSTPGISSVSLARSEHYPFFLEHSCRFRCSYDESQTTRIFEECFRSNSSSSRTDS